MAPHRRQMLILIAVLVNFAWASIGYAQFLAPDIYEDLVVSESDARKLSAQTISRFQALQDIQTLRRVIERAYAGYDHFQNLGIDWDGVFADCEEEINRMPEPIAVEDYYNFLHDRFRFTNDGHLCLFIVFEDFQYYVDSTIEHDAPYTVNLMFRRTRTGWVVAQDGINHGTGQDSLLGARLADVEKASLDDLMVPGARMIDGSLVTGWILRFYSQRPMERMRFVFEFGDDKSQGYLIRPRRMELASNCRNKGPALAVDRKGDIPIVQLRTFLAPSLLWMHPLKNLSSEYINQSIVALDMRGNRGGFSDPVADWFTGLNVGPLESYSEYYVDSEVALQGTLNNLVFKMAADRSGKARQQEYRKDIEHYWNRLLEVKLEKQGEPFRSIIHNKRVIQQKPGDSFAGTMLLMVDGQCGSACETFVHLARQVPGTIVLGENTMGSVTFPASLYFRLPNSRLWLTVGHKRTKPDSIDYSFTEGRGYEPDIWIDSAEPLACQREIAQCLSDPECAGRIHGLIERSRAYKRAGKMMVLSE